MTLVDQWHQWLLVLILSTLVIEVKKKMIHSKYKKKKNMKLISFKLFSLVISVILAFIMDRETKEEETYMAVLASQHNPPWFSENSRGLARHRSSFTQRSIPKYGSTPSTRT
jgi:hypothetical protein